MRPDDRYRKIVTTPRPVAGGFNGGPARVVRDDLGGCARGQVWRVKNRQQRSDLYEQKLISGETGIRCDGHHSWSGDRLADGTGAQLRLSWVTRRRACRRLVTVSSLAPVACWAISVRTRGAMVRR